MLLARQTDVYCQVLPFATIFSLSCLINAAVAGSLDPRNTAPSPISISPSQEFGKWRRTVLGHYYSINTSKMAMMDLGRPSLSRLETLLKASKS